LERTFLKEYLSVTARVFLLLAAVLVSSHNVLAATVSVSVERLSDVRVARELRAPATVLSANRAIVTSEVTALISQVLVDVGASVKKGATLVRLDDDNARLALAQARTTLASLDAQIVQAKHRLGKAEELLTRDFISDDELISRQTDVAVLEANRQGQLVAIQIAELALARTQIRAPFDATVVQRQAQVGNFAQPGSRLLTLVQTNQREVDAELDPRYAVDIPVVADIRYVSMGQEYPLSLLRLSDVIETDTRRLRVRLKFVDVAAPIGSTGEIAWTEGNGVMPVNLIVQRGPVFGVFVAKNNKATFVEIALAQEGRPASLNLPDDTLIVTRGHIRLQDGDELVIDTE
jgi:RND family efflux transporter MFP subunit